MISLSRPGDGAILSCLLAVLTSMYLNVTAAVVVLPKEEELSDRAQLQIAVEMNLSETVYLQKQDGETPKFGIRWYVPRCDTH